MWSLRAVAIPYERDYSEELAEFFTERGYTAETMAGLEEVELNGRPQDAVLLDVRMEYGEVVADFYRAMEES